MRVNSKIYGDGGVTRHNTKILNPFLLVDFGAVNPDQKLDRCIYSKC